ncbi:histone-like nucleoid-structuring protein, MvaT/MvaU family [Pseudomonas sp. F1_0610]|uniref:histone-like nucleoid-structuring protein, MvaT/MvaU family n=1 Tax=Pseudomonas sp. F1_0610 TaxID=3114284 RepID=UPI0039C1058D
MKLLSSYAESKKALEELKAQIARLESDPKFAKEKAFVEALDKLLKDHGKTQADLQAYLFPETTKRTSKIRKPRAVKTYKNPHTKETVTTAGGNHKKLNEWRAKYPKEDISTWVVSTK